MQKMTHTGTIKSCNARTSNDYKHIIQLRETKNYWIGIHGYKYSKKKDGYGLDDWEKLDLTSIKSISI